MRSRLSIFASALWWGSLSAVGLLVVPLLFVHLPTPTLAGNTAAKLFSAQTWISVACGLVLLLDLKRKAPEALVNRSWTAMMFIVGGMILALLVEFAIGPRIAMREDLRLWHSVGSGLFLLQWLCAGATLWWAASPPGSSIDHQV